MSPRRAPQDGVTRLDGYGYRELLTMLGDPARVETRYATAIGWQPGDGRPALATDDPAVAQAMGRCALDRAVRGDTPVGGVARLRMVHSTPCGWCDYPLDELVAACAHAVWTSRFVAVEFAVWEGVHGREEARPTGRAGTYENPVWAAFFALSPGDRRRRIDHAAAREVSA